MRLLILLLAVGTLPTVSRSQGQDHFFLGVTAGVSRMSMSGDVPDKGSYTRVTGFSAGLLGEYTLTADTRLSIEPSYVQRGTGVAFDIGRGEPHDSLTLTLDYFSIPLLARFMMPGEIWFINGGLDLGFLVRASLRDITLGSTRDVHDFINSMDLMMNVGTGAALHIDPVVLSFEIRYAQSLLNAGANNDLTTLVGIPRRFRSSGFQILIAAVVPL